MSETCNTIEKIYCCDGGYGRRYDNNDALYALLAQNQNRNCDPMAMAAMMNGGGFGNGGWNNPFVYLVWMMFAQRMWGNNGWGMNGQGLQDVEIQQQLQAIRSQMQDNQNSNLLMDAVKGNDFAISQLAQNLNCDFKALQGSVCDVRAGIDRLSGQVGFSAERVINAGQLGDMNIISALKDCCCQNKELVQRMGYENQLGQKDIIFNSQKGFCDLGYKLQGGLDFVNRTVERGFAASDYATQKQTCDIINAGAANTQRIVDVLQNHWSTEQANQIQDLKAEVSQLRQTDRILGRLTGNAYYNGNGGCCGCNGNGFGGF